MKANKTHISLETAKLLKDCGVESKYLFAKGFHGFEVIKKMHLDFKVENYPAYTWQEILWENAEKFFGGTLHHDGLIKLYKYEIHTKEILTLLQQKKYQEADEYFRENCVLIK